MGSGIGGTSHGLAFSESGHETAQNRLRFAAEQARKERDTLLFDRYGVTPGGDMTLAWLFPDVDCGIVPFGTRVVVQLRRAQKFSRGGIELVSESKEAEEDNTQVAKVISFGHLAFKNRESLEPWPEGAWAKAGEYVRITRWGGDRWEVPVEGEKDEPAIFAMFNDGELMGRVTTDPRLMKAWLR